MNSLLGKKIPRLQSRGNLCPLCHSPCAFLFHKNKQDYFACPVCRFQFIWPIPTPKQLQKLYATSYWQRRSHRSQNALGYLSYLKEKNSFLDYFQKILTQIQNHYPRLSGCVLDIGASFGLFLQVAKRQGWQIYGLDLSPAAVRKAKLHLQVATIYNKTLHQAHFPPHYFNLVTIFQTIEHIPHLTQFLSEASRVLKSRGVLVITTPDSAGIQARLMGKNWFSYRHPDHLYFFNFDNLSALLKNHGFVKIKRIKDPARLYPLGYLLDNFKFYTQSRFLTIMAKIATTLLAPFAKINLPLPLDSLVVTAEKP